METTYFSFTKIKTIHHYIDSKMVRIMGGNPKEGFHIYCTTSDQIVWGPYGYFDFVRRLCAFYQEYEDDCINEYTMSQINLPATEATTIYELLNEFPKKVRKFVISLAEINDRNENGELLEDIKETEGKQKYINDLEQEHKKMYTLLSKISENDCYVGEIKKSVTDLLNIIAKKNYKFITDKCSGKSPNKTKENIVEGSCTDDEYTHDTKLMLLKLISNQQ
jgi:hypothetical protein